MTVPCGGGSERSSGMKTILVPTQHIATMKSALETAVLLARRTGAYLEGFPLRTIIPPYVVAELTAGLSMDAYDTQRDEETAELRRLSRRKRSPPTSWCTGTALPSRRAPTPLRCRCCRWPAGSPC